MYLVFSLVFRAGIGVWVCGAVCGAGEWLCFQAKLGPHDLSKEVMVVQVRKRPHREQRAGGGGAGTSQVW